MKRRQTKTAAALRITLIVVLLAVAAVLLLGQNLGQTVLDMAFARAYSTAVETLNHAVKRAMEDGVSYEELISTQMDAQGQVAMLRANTMRMNELAAHTAMLAQEALDDETNQYVEVPLGAALGSGVLSGFGPPVSVRILPVGAVHASFETQFETAGINQTRHKILLTLRVTVSLIIPTGSQTVEVASTVPIAESIIVGRVPDSFVDVNDSGDILDLVP